MGLSYRMFKPALTAIGWALAWLTAGASWPAAAASATDAPPPARREFRGLWVATVNNIDWPSQRGLSTRRQQEELLALLDRAAALHLNAIILQVRPACDAFYDSKIEPWSEYLTGQAGQAPSPNYDPLAFAVAEAHRRGLELHAWFNPYRVSLHIPAPAASRSVAVRHPELVRAYGKQLWLDPGEEETPLYSSNVILDVVRRYDIDGVHFDDYFYPYPEKNEQGKEIEFPDGAAWARYQARGGKLSHPDWRRQNVNHFVESIYHAIKQEKPWVKFGISPFGIWRPGYPAQISGFDAYNELFADSRKWLAEGWIDYLSPQLYWPIGQKAQSFPALLQWWTAQNSRRRNLWPGMQLTGWKGVPDDAKEAVSEVELTRRNDVSGVILWHAGPLMRNQDGVAAALQREVYDGPALVPACPWLSADRPARPYLRVKLGAGELKLNWNAASGPVWLWLLQKETGGQWTTEILPAQSLSASFKTANGIERVCLSAVNRYGDLSPCASYPARP